MPRRTIITEKEKRTGATYRELREQSGLSRAQLAEMLGVSEKIIQYREDGECAIKVEAWWALDALIVRLRQKKTDRLVSEGRG